MCTVAASAMFSVSTNHMEFLDILKGMSGSSFDSDLVLVKKKNVTSIVLDYFRLKAIACGRVIDSEASHSMYLSCKKSVPAKGSNLLVHLRDSCTIKLTPRFPGRKVKGVVTLAPVQLL